MWCVTLGLHWLSWGSPAPRKRVEAFITTVQPHHFTARFGTFPIYFYQTGTLKSLKADYVLNWAATLGLSS